MATHIWEVYLTKAVFRMHVLAAGHGDCLWVDYGDPSAPTRILVDAGTVGTLKRLRPALDLVRARAPSHELFIVTHIDADHIGGALELLEDSTLGGQFKEIWFNGRAHLIQAASLQPLGAVQGERLTAALNVMRARWNASLGGAPVMMPTSGPPRSFSFGTGKVTVLSPESAQLADLLPVWDKEVRAAGLLAAARIIKRPPPPPGWQSFGALNVAALANTSVTPDGAKANGSSIATLVEFEGRRLLLSADAHPDVLLNGIRRLTPTNPLRVDVWKLSHHGSAANLTPALLDAVEAKTVVFSSNGAYFRHPDQIAVARVLQRYQGSGVHLVFNYKTKHNKMWDSPTLKQHWNYTTDYGAGQTGITVKLL